jgi:hypothetical protein
VEPSLIVIENKVTALYPPLKKTAAAKGLCEKKIQDAYKFVLETAYANV